MWYRVFSSLLVDLSPTSVLEELSAHGFSPEARFRGDDLGWFACEFHFPSGAPVVLERFLSDGDDIRDDLNTWAAWIEAQHYEPRRFALMERVIQTKQLFALREPMDHADEATLKRFCLKLMRLLATKTEGIYQIDGAGFFDAEGESLLEEY